MFAYHTTVGKKMKVLRIFPILFLTLCIALVVLGLSSLMYSWLLHETIKTGKQTTEVSNIEEIKFFGFISSCFGLFLLAMYNFYHGRQVREFWDTHRKRNLLKDVREQFILNTQIDGIWSKDFISSQKYLKFLPEKQSI